MVQLLAGFAKQGKNTKHDGKKDLEVGKEKGVETVESRWTPLSISLKSTLMFVPAAVLLPFSFLVPPHIQQPLSNVINLTILLPSLGTNYLNLKHPFTHPQCTTILTQTTHSTGSGSSPPPSLLSPSLSLSTATLTWQPAPSSSSTSSLLLSSTSCEWKMRTRSSTSRRSTRLKERPFRKESKLGKKNKSIIRWFSIRTIIPCLCTAAG